MFHSQDQIIEKAKIVLTKSKFFFDDEDGFTATLNSQSQLLNRDQDTWSVNFVWGREEFGKSRSAILYMDDKTGHPLLLTHSTGSGKIFYTIKENEVIGSNGVKYEL